MGVKPPFAKMDSVQRPKRCHYNTQEGGLNPPYRGGNVVC